MAVDTVRFAADVDDFVSKSTALLEAVFRQSAQDVIEYMQQPVAEGGNMPVETGFLRASMQVSLSGVRPMSQENPGSAKHQYNPDAAVLIISGAKLGDTIFASYSAKYAAHQNYGTENFAGRHFVGLAAQRWQQIVSANVQRVKSMREGPSDGTPTLI